MRIYHAMKETSYLTERPQTDWFWQDSNNYRQLFLAGICAQNLELTQVAPAGRPAHAAVPAGIHSGNITTCRQPPAQFATGQMRCSNGSNTPRSSATNRRGSTVLPAVTRGSPPGDYQPATPALDPAASAFLSRAGIPPLLFKNPRPAQLPHTVA